MSEQDVVAEELEIPQDAEMEALADDEAPEAEAEEFEEVDWDEGKKVKVTKGFKDALMREQDYRHKTHELGQTKRSLEAKEREIQERAREHEQFLDDVAEVRSIDKQIAEYKKITPEQWVQWRQSDRDAADNAQFALNLMLQKRQEMVGSIEEKKSNARRQQQEAAKAWEEENERALKTKIKDWSPERERAIKAHAAAEFGLTEKELSGVKDARLLAMMDYAYSQAKALKAAQAKLKEVTTREEPAPEPVAKLAGRNANAGGRVSLKDSPEAWDRAFLKRYNSKR